jgi:ATP-binding cassette, subfamily F, member 3
MINIQNLYLQYGDRIIFDRFNFSIGDRDRVGLVGRNGAGKSTMLKAIAGEVNVDSGNVVRPSNSTIGYLHQEMMLPKGKTVLEETMSVFDELKTIDNRIEAINEELMHRTDYESDAYSNILIELSDLTERVSLVGGDTAQANAERILKGLGFKQRDFHRLTDEFSGGWQMRIELAKMLLQRPDYLLLDEPTNHLDIESILWLEDFLKTYPGAIVLISHDRQFLDTITTRTIEIELGNLYDYKAGYTKAMELRAIRREQMQSAFDNQQQKIAQTERLIDRFRAKASKAKFAQSLIKQLDKVERIELSDEDTDAMNIRFPPSPRAGQIVAEAQSVKKNYGDLQVLNGASFQLQRSERVAFVGQNGQGKTTLAKILIGNEPASGGDIILGHNVMVGYYAQNQAENLDPNKTLLETMEQSSPPEMRTKLRSILGSFLFTGEDVDKKVFVLSGGERARLAMACMMLRPINLMILDEPTNHLDMISKEVLKDAVKSYDGALIVVSHDRDFLQGLTSRVIEFRDQVLHDHIGDINAFLEKRALSNMREVEMSKNAGSSKANAKKENVTDEERRRLQKNLQGAEKKIEQLEKQIKQVEITMAASDFYLSPTKNKVSENYKSLKRELDATMNEWEAAQVELDMVS